MACAQKGDIPVSVLVMTRNEAGRLRACLEKLQAFSEVVVVDSGSDDGTAELARKEGAKVVDFTWNGRYPKKRQWCLDNLPLKHDWVLFIDADEILTQELINEIRTLSFDRQGYFIRGRYVLTGRPLRFGLQNNKLCLFDRRAFAFPEVDDLDLPGMGEIEGHYQPIPRYAGVKAGQLRSPLFHYAEAGWRRRHERYALWEAGMNRKNAWPADPVIWRQMLKRLFRALPARPLWAFLHCYIWKRGVFDGKRGWDFALSRASYYRMIGKA